MTEVERQIIRNIQTHDLAERYRLRRAIWAQEMDLPIIEFAQPFPITQTVNHYHTPKERKPFWTAGNALTLLLFLLGLVVLAGVGLGIVAWNDSKPLKVPPLSFDVEWQDENGKWNKMVKPREADPNK